MPPSDDLVVGWDVGGAHLKACLHVDGRVAGVAQWPCPLWQGLEHLEHAAALVRARWPGLDGARHAVTMTGELTDLFPHREDGVRRIASALADAFGPASRWRYYAGDAGWCGAEALTSLWPQVASANWLATANHTAAAFAPAPGVLVDIGSTTTDLVAFGGGRVLTAARSDAERLAGGELVYHGVVRTPLCAFAPRIDWRGQPHNVMNELFATAADVYRLTGELDPAHDQHDAADRGAKDAAGSRRRLARMIGLDARDADDVEWQRLAHAWRAAQVREMAGQLARVRARHGLPADALVVAAGCGDFLVANVAAEAGLGSATLRRYADDVAGLGASPVRAWAQVCAPCIATAALFARDPEGR